MRDDEVGHGHEEHGKTNGKGGGWWRSWAGRRERVADAPIYNESGDEAAAGSDGAARHAGSVLGTAGAAITLYIGKRRARSADKRAGLMTRIRHYEASAPAFPTEKVEKAREEATSAIAETAAEMVRGLDQLRGHRIAAFTHFRNMQSIHGTIRPAIVPDVVFTIFFVIIGFFVEGAAAGAMMSIDGKTGVLPGLAYGLAFAGVNVALAMATGFVARWLNHRAMPGPYDPVGRPKRLAAAAGVAVGIGILCVLIFAAMRTRALGTHSGVFQFEQVGFWQSFDDSIALAILALGLVASFIGFAKGYGGLFDPIPGYGHAQLAAEQGSDEKADELAEDGADVIEDIAERITGQIEDHCRTAAKRQKRRIKTHRKLLKATHRHNNSVERLRTDYHSYCRQVHSGASYVAGGDTSGEVPLGDEDFDRERIDPGALSAPAADALPEQPEMLLSGLDAARESALARITAAHVRFKAEAPSFITQTQGGQTS